MADNEKKQEDQKEEQAQEAGKKKSPLTKIILIAVIVIIVTAAGITAFLLIGTKQDSEMREPEEKKQLKIEQTVLGPVVALEPFIVNLSGNGGSNYLKADISLELSAQEMQNEINNKMPRIRDTILLILSTKTFDDIKTIGGKNTLKDDILYRINDFLQTGRITNIYFTSFVVQ